MSLNFFYTSFFALVFFCSNSYAEKVFFIGERGAFYHSLFLNDENFRAQVANNISESDILVVLEPTMLETKKLVFDYDKKRKKFLFVFYKDAPKNMKFLPHLNLTPTSSHLDKVELDQISNSPFKGSKHSYKVKLAIQYRVWQSLFFHLSLARPISDRDILLMNYW